ncbi:MAG: PP2C family protein-serine/threonine phosphatase [Methylococcaceae bacterium]
MSQEIKLKRLCQREPAKTLLLGLMQLSQQSHCIRDAMGLTILESPGTFTPNGRTILIPVPGEPAEEFLGSVTGGELSELLAGWVGYLAHKELESRHLAQDTLSKYKELTLLYELGEKIAACVDESELAHLALQEARALLSGAEDICIGILVAEDSLSGFRVMAGESPWFFLDQKIKTMDGITVQVLTGGQAELVNEVNQDPRFKSEPGHFTGIAAMIGVPLKTRERIFGVLSVVSTRRTVFNAAQLKVLNLLAAQVAIALGRVQLIKSRVEQERLEESLKLSRGIQMSMLPTGFPRFSSGSHIDIYACMEPARQVSGDFYDFFSLDDQTLLLVIGDVSDKGMPAALFMVMVKTLIRAYAQAYRLPHRILSAVNPELCRDNNTMMFVTLFVATLDITSGLLTYSFAGHNPPLLLGRDGGVVFLPGDSGTALGIMEGMEFIDQQALIKPGEGLLLYTDGISEAMSAELEEFGEERLALLLNNRFRLDAEQMVDTVMQAVKHFTTGAEQSDDITLLAVRLKD